MDLDLGGLQVQVCCGDTIQEGLQTAQLCLKATAGILAGPALPERLIPLPLSTAEAIITLKSTGEVVWIIEHGAAMTSFLVQSSIDTPFLLT